ncbi:MAG: pentapeptide repeat-containing protein [Bauldia sp.]
MTVPKSGRPLPVVAALAAMVLTAASAALAQPTDVTRSTIRNLVIGAPFSEQPSGFQEFACGTNGGPPSVPIAGFAEFARCPPEPSGLYEVQFRYDDEAHFRALAHRDLLQAELFAGTKIGNFQIIAAALFDRAGILRGIRAVTDDRMPDRERRFAYSMAVFVQSLYGAGSWECTDLPVAEGETPVGNSLVKQDCRKLTDDGLVVTTRARLLRRPGQTLFDPATNQIRVGYYESTARMEVFQADTAGEPIYSGTTEPPPVAIAEPPVPTDRIAAFLAGASIDCPGCDLSGADLARRNLAGADLSGANLSGASLHRALLGRATLDGADLTDANLNLADLKFASLTGADLTGALLYQADAAGASFAGAKLDRLVAERARFTSATLSDVTWQNAYALGANLAGADLSGAILTGSVFVEADLQLAVLAGADLTDVTFYRSRLRGVDLTGTTALRTDFLEADLANTIFVNADLSEARLLRARATGMDLTGAILTNTILPDGRIGP